MTPNQGQDLVNLNLLNETELAQLVRRQTGVIIKRSVGKDRLIQIIEFGGGVLPEEACPTNESRRTLQLYIEKNWEGLNSQLPCKGLDRGKCTIYPCPEGRHIDCLQAATPHLKLHSL